MSVFHLSVGTNELRTFRISFISSHPFCEYTERNEHFCG